MQEQTPIQYQYNNQWHTAKCDKCLHKILGDQIDISWNIKTGVLKIRSSQTLSAQQIGISDKNEVQYIRNVGFVHQAACPLADETVLKNSTRTMKTCSTVLLRDFHNNVLLTRRNKQKTLGGAWVLPGGHLEINQNIFQGGLRQCSEEVGLPTQQLQKHLNACQHVMAFQSVHYDKETKKIKAGIVLYFSTLCSKFQVKMAEEEVIQYKWKSLENNEDENLYNPQKKEGYGQGLMHFINYVRRQLGIKLKTE